MSERARGATSVSLEFRLTDVTTGAPKTGLDVTALKLQFHRPGAAPSTATSLTLLATQTTAYTAHGAKEVDATNSPGVYRVDCPDGAFATGADEVTLTVNGAAIQPATRLIDLVTLDARAASAPTNWITAAALATDAKTAITAAVAAQITVDHGPGSYVRNTEPPTAVQVRQEMDSSSTKLVNLDAPVSSRSTYAGGTVAGVTAPVTVADGSITSAKFTVSSPAAGLPSGILEKIDRVFRRFFKKSDRTTTQLKTYADDGTTVLTTQAVSDDGSGNESQGAAS